MCLFKTISIYVVEILLLIGFFTVFYDYDIMLHVAVVFAAIGTILPIYDRHKECQKANEVKADSETTAFTSE